MENEIPVVDRGCLENIQPLRLCFAYCMAGDLVDSPHVFHSGPVAECLSEFFHLHHSCVAMMGTNRPGAVCPVYLGELWGPTPALTSHPPGHRKLEVLVLGMCLVWKEGQCQRPTPQRSTGRPGLKRRGVHQGAKLRRAFPTDVSCASCRIPRVTGATRGGEGMWVTVSAIVTTFPPRDHHYKGECLSFKPVTPNFLLFLAIINSS